METKERTVITIGATIQSSMEKVWECWSEPKHIVHWNNASPDWHTPKAENDLKVNGTFTYTMAARDGSMSFDFGGTYTKVEKFKRIEYIMNDGRKAKNDFQPLGDRVKVVVTFEAESENSIELQRGGWQAILDNFKQYVQSK
ncbi:MAG: SRPBCC family protein [Cyclobacteriaceae bacterium]|nr:SRPBCC family protein [Cyclobacteriaceae bacterium]